MQALVHGKSPFTSCHHPLNSLSCSFVWHVCIYAYPCMYSLSHSDTHIHTQHSLYLFSLCVCIGFGRWGGGGCDQCRKARQHGPPAPSLHQRQQRTHLQVSLHTFDPYSFYYVRIESHLRRSRPSYLQSQMHLNSHR